MMTEKILGRGQWKETSDKNRVVYSTFRQRKKLSTARCGTLRSATVELKSARVRLTEYAVVRRYFDGSQVLVWVPSAQTKCLGTFHLEPT